MRPWLHLAFTDLVAQRPAGSDVDVHFVESLVAAVLDEYTSPGDVVLDPFAGYGTTLVVAERMRRGAIGVELLEAHADVVRARTNGRSAIISGDARDLASLVRQPVDLCLTSPPYMTVTDHPQNPLTGYKTLDGRYGTYLSEIADVFRQAAVLLRPGGHVVINVANIETRDGITPLAWDVARAVAPYLTLRHECLLCWDHQPPGISSDYLLVFQRTTP